MDVDMQRAAKIAAVNDRFRGMALNVMITPGVRDLPEVVELMKAVEKFDTFNMDNDPYGEHDCGSLEWHGQWVFWKIDYTDINSGHWRDPLDEECHRIITVMLASEY